MFFGGHTFSGFRGVNLKGSVAIRLAVNAVEGTMSADQIEASRAWRFPDKSGTFPISGTFTVNLPAVAAGATSNTNVTVAGIRVEDGLTCSMVNMTTTGMSERGYVFIGAAAPGNGGVNLTFINPMATATIYKDIILSYTAVR